MREVDALAAALAEEAADDVAATRERLGCPRPGRAGLGRGGVGRRRERRATLAAELLARLVPGPAGGARGLERVSTLGAEATLGAVVVFAGGTAHRGPVTEVSSYLLYFIGRWSTASFSFRRATSCAGSTPSRRRRPRTLTCPVEWTERVRCRGGDQVRRERRRARRRPAGTGCARPGDGRRGVVARRPHALCGRRCSRGELRRLAAETCRSHKKRAAASRPERRPDLPPTRLFLGATAGGW